MKSLSIQSLVLSLALMCFAGGQALADSVVATIQGTKQGAFKGDPATSNRIPLLSVSHQITSPRDPASGQATGKRQHGAIMISKEIGASTPMGLQALVTNEILSNVTVSFFRRPADVTPYYTIKLTNAAITSFKQVTNEPARAGAASRQTEELSLTYQKIEWTWTDGNVSVSDDLVAR